MIGRKLDEMLEIGANPLPIIGKLSRELRKIVLPLQKLSYDYYAKDEKTGEFRIELLDSDWSRTSCFQSLDIRNCAKAFEKRKKANIGESYHFSGAQTNLFGTYQAEEMAERVDKDAIIFYNGRDKYLIASNKESLLKHESRGCIPVLYRRIIL